MSNRDLNDTPSHHVSYNLDEELQDAITPSPVHSRRRAKHAHLAPRQSGRHTRPPEYYVPEDYRHPKSHLTYCLAASTQHYEPQSYKEAVTCSDAALWQVAIDSELASLAENETWTITSLPGGRKPVGSKWVFKIKLKADGSVARYKGRVMAKGYSQIPGVDYDDTFSPVVKLTTLRLFVALAAVHDFELEQLDVKTTFLYGKLQEDIYMEVPEGVPIPADISRPVCHLKKTIYGLKQSPRAWYSRIDAYLQALGYVSIHADSNVYIKREGTNFVAVAVYVDDIIVMSNSLRMIHTLKGQLSSEFQMTDAGALQYCLGMQLVRDRKAGTIFLHQSKYARQILERYEMQNSKPAATPVEQNTKYTAQVGALPEDEYDEVADYPSRNGSLMHLTIGTRPDLSFSSGLASRFVSNPQLST